MKRSIVVASMLLAACAKPGGPLRQFPVEIPAGLTCSPVLSPPELEKSHIAPPAKGRYNTDPPTSGIHYSGPGAPAKVGVYTKPIIDEAQVHNLEHGHVMIQYSALSKDDLARIKAIVSADPSKIVVAPRLAMPWTLALTAWAKIQVCNAVPQDLEAMISSFVAAHRDHAPESID